VTSHRLSTARARLVATLAEEILQHPEGDSFAIASEHQLCRRFQISRVTVRLALGDLENRGLIYRRHGKGTFAHGRKQQVFRDIGFLMKDAPVREQRPIGELIRGAQTVVSTLRSAVVLLSRPPEEWRPELAGSLGGVVVIPDNVEERDLQVLRERNVPFILAMSSRLSGPKVNFGQVEAARTMTERLLRHRRFAFLSGSHPSLDALKRNGVHDALRASALDPAEMPEFSVGPEEDALEAALGTFLQLSPRPTALIACDDTLGALAAFHLRREGLRVPEDVSIVGFHEGPAFPCLEPGLATARFDFFAAGQRAAEALNHATLTGMPVTDLFFEPVYRDGQSVVSPSNEMPRDLIPFRDGNASVPRSPSSAAVR
jgi:DNA-binding LacI/PurR family transcriptional regulator